MGEPTAQRLNAPDADLWFDAGFIEPDAADRTFECLIGCIDWRQHEIQLFGRRVATPRLSAWYGDAGARYSYSGVDLEPQMWIPALAELKERVEVYSRRVAPDVRYDSVLANLYRDGSDSMGWHSDDEPELGDRPVIASLSLGAPRRFRLKHRFRQELEAISLTLTHGSLLLMLGDTQSHWKHQLPKTAGLDAARINLTFRRVRSGTR